MAKSIKMTPSRNPDLVVGAVVIYRDRECRILALEHEWTLFEGRRRDLQPPDAKAGEQVRLRGVAGELDELEGDTVRVLKPGRGFVILDVPEVGQLRTRQTEVKAKIK